MPQVKHNFIGDRLDRQMPDIVKTVMNPDEWNHFVREINTAIRDAQSYMRFSPWLICTLVCVATGVVLLDVALSQGVFGNAQAGTLTLSAFVTIGVLIICYLSMCRPTNYCESQVEKICEEYSDSERDLYFFYRHHNNMVHVTENRFYIEVFVGALPPEEAGNVRMMSEERTSEDDIKREGDVEWADDAIPTSSAEQRDEQHRQLLLTGTASTVSTTALTVSTSDTNSSRKGAATTPQKSLLMTAGPATTTSQALVPAAGGTTAPHDIVVVPRAPPPSGALVPRASRDIV